MVNRYKRSQHKMLCVYHMKYEEYILGQLYEVVKQEYCENCEVKK